MKRLLCVAVLLTALATSSQAQRKTQIVEPVKSAQQTDGKTIKRKVAIGRFSNETQYAKGIFYDKENDPMGKQALDILSAKLAASGKFLLLERSDLAQLLEEAKKSESGLQTIGADYMIIGSITEFGRKNTGKEGVFTSTKMQTVEAAVAIWWTCRQDLSSILTRPRGRLRLPRGARWVWAVVPTTTLR